MKASLCKETYVFEAVEINENLLFFYKFYKISIPDAVRVIFFSFFISDLPPENCPS